MSLFKTNLLSFLLTIHCFSVLLMQIQGEDKVWNGTYNTVTHDITRRRLRKSKTAKQLEYPNFLLKSGKVKSKKSKSSKSKGTKSSKGSGKGKGSGSSSRNSSSKSNDDCDGRGKGFVRRCKTNVSDSTLNKVPTTIPSVGTSLAPTAAPSDSTWSPSSFPTIRSSQSPTSSPSVYSDSFPSQPPSSFPTIEFNLQMCESYSRRW
jgi:hypothetical protein